MTTAKTVQMTTDAAMVYHERTAVDIARAESTAHDGTLASLTKDATFIASRTTFYPVYGSTDVVYTEHLEEQVESVYLQR